MIGRIEYFFCSPPSLPANPQFQISSEIFPRYIVGSAGTISGGGGSRIPGLRRMDSSGERSHRQLIDCIRSKDTDALIDAIDAGGI